MPAPKEDPPLKKRKAPPAKTLEARQNQLIALAVDRAEQQLIDGTASAQVITHLLKLASVREQKEMEKLEQENLLLKARTDAIANAASSEEMYRNAIEAIKRYNGDSGGEVYDD